MKLKITDEFFLTKETSPLVVAEISANHCGNKSRFLKHILEAKKNGADLVKIQSYEENDISMNLSKLSKNYKLKNNHKIYSKSKTPYSWHHDAFKLARKYKITLFSSPFSLQSVELLEKLNCPIYKIASLEITDFGLIKKVAQTYKPIIISCGASYIKELKAALKLINKYHNKVILMYCRTSYPLDEKLSNLSSILKMKKVFKKNYIGYSDHTNNIDTSLVAGILGAKIIEKHFVIDNKKTYDSEFSIKPKQLIDLKKKLKQNCEIIGYQEPYLLKDELLKRKYRRSIYAKQNINKGEKFTNKNIISLRPKIGMCSSKYIRLINKLSKRNYKKNSPINNNEIL